MRVHNFDILTANKFICENCQFDFDIISWEYSVLHACMCVHIFIHTLHVYKCQTPRGCNSINDYNLIL